MIIIRGMKEEHSLSLKEMLNKIMLILQIAVNNT